MGTPGSNILVSDTERSQEHERSHYDLSKMESVEEFKDKGVTSDHLKIAVSSRENPKKRQKQQDTTDEMTQRMHATDGKGRFLGGVRRTLRHHNNSQDQENQQDDVLVSTAK